jgi:hypothetical protein
MFDYVCVHVSVRLHGGDFFPEFVSLEKNSWPLHVVDWM